MGELQITLSGNVTASNFDEWKNQLLARLDEANRDLQTDDDFAHAAQLVKSFKAAEDNLKTAKQDALNQVSDIQALFGAIDEVVEQVRQTRLGLDKQVKARKEEIKNSAVSAGKERIQAFINQQPEYFQQQNCDDYLDHSRFLEATKRKMTAATLQKSIDELCSGIELEVSRASATVQANKHRIEQLPPADRELFPDVLDLIAQQPQTVEDEIKNRLDQRNLRVAARLDNADDPGELVLEQGAPVSSALSSDAEKFRVILDICADETSARQFVEQLASDTYGNVALGNIRLERRPQSSWDDALRHADTEFIDLLKVYREQQHEIPEVGFEVTDSNDRVTDLILPLAWPDRRFSVVKTMVDKTRALALGWDAMLLEEAMRETMQDG